MADDSSNTEPTQRELSEAAAARLRDAAKWLVASFAAVGATLVAGSQLSSIGKLPICFDWLSLRCSRLPIAILGAIVGLVSVVWAIWIAVELLTPESMAPDRLKEEWKRGEKSAVYRYFHLNPSYMQGFIDFEDQERLVAEAYARFDELDKEHDQAPDPQRRAIAKEMRRVKSEIENLLAKSEAVVAVANEVAYAATFRSKSKRGILLAAGFASLGVVVFAWAANPPTSKPLPSVSLIGADLVGADLGGANLRLADLSSVNLTGVDFSDSDLEGAILDGAVLSRIKWSNTVCPDGSNSDAAGGNCLNHLSAVAAGDQVQD